VKGWLLGLVWLLALAQSQPIDPLLRPEEEAGMLRYSLGLSYAPQVLQALGADPERGLYSLTQVQHRLDLAGRLEYTLDPRWSAWLALALQAQLVQSERRFAQETRYENRLGLGWGGSLGVRYRLEPDSALDPRLSLALRYPWAAHYSLSASLLRDPVVLAASLGFSDALDGGPSSLSLSLGAGFVANEQVSFSLSKSLSWSLEALVHPGATLRLQTSYTLDAQREQQLAVYTSFGWQGEVIRPGFGLEVGGLLR